jgi:endonuclease III
VARPRSPRGRAREVLARLGAARPGTAAELATLDFSNPFELLVATVLSAQTTDVGVNKVTPVLFARWPTPEDLASADPDELEAVLRPTGFYRAKARSVRGLAEALVERFGGEVPTSMAALTTLPGVGRKTANVVRSIGFGLPGLPVDTHVGRVARRLRLTTEEDPVKAEAELNALVPPADRGRFSLLLILHGRTTCTARRPRCADCNVNDICPSAFRADLGARSGRNGS